MSQEPSIDPQQGEIADGMVEIPGATEILGRRGVRPTDATTGAQPVEGPPISADSPARREDTAAPETPAAPAPVAPPAPSAAETSGGVSARRKNARAGAVAVILGAGASVLAAIRRRRGDASQAQASEAPPAATAASPAVPAAVTETASPSGPPADVEVSLTAGVTTDDDPTTLTSGDAKHLDLPRQRREAEAERAEAERQAAAPGPSEGAANVSLTGGVIPPDARTPTTDQRRD